MPHFSSLDTADVKGKTVLVRADLNVPMETDAQGIAHVSDTTRIDRLIPTIQELTQKGAKVVLLSHFGRPKNRDAKDSLTQILPALNHAFGQNVAFAEDCIGEAAEYGVQGMSEGGILLLENLRYHAEEEKNDLAFAKKLAKLGDVYVNDAFSASHRAHASIEALAGLLPAYAGRLMQAELDALNAALESPQKPVVALVGGSKISTKLDLLYNLVEKVDVLVLGGGMANTFLAAQGVSVGASLCENDMLEQARSISSKAKTKGCTILLPVDAVVADDIKSTATKTVDIHAIAANDKMFDIGEASIAAINAALGSAKTVLWNGPLGVFEFPAFAHGTNAVAAKVAELTKAGALISVAGGGDTVAALNKAGVEADLTYVSSAGGAFLEWLEGKVLPGVAALESHARAA